MTPRDAILAYFAGERAEMIAILAGGAAALTGACVLWLKARDGFAAGFALTTILAALLLGITAASLLARDGKMVPALTRAASSLPDANTALAGERSRIGAVIRNYAAYRVVAVILVGLALAGLLLTSRGWINGVAAALLLLAAAQVLIDHYSEARARAYSERLAES